MYLADRPRPSAPSAQASGQGRTARVSSTVLLMGTVSLLTDVSSEAVSAVLPLFLTAVVGLSPLAYGFVDGLYQGVSALVRILGGWWADRSDRPKWVATLGYGLSALSKVGLLVTASLGAITTVITIDRLGKGLRTAPRDALIASVTPTEDLGRAFGTHRAMDTVGAAIGPLSAFAVLWFLPGDYTSVFVVSLAFALMGVLVLVALVPDHRPRAERAPATPPPSLRLLRDPRLGKVALAAGMLGLLTVSDGFLYLSLQRRDDFAATWFPLLFVGTNLAYALLARPIGRVADRFGRAKVLVAGHLFLVGAYLGTSGAGSGLAWTVLTLTCLGAFYASTDGVLAALTSTVTAAEVRGSGIATTQTVTALARFASSVAFGSLWVWWGRDRAVLAMGAALCVTLPLVWLLVRGLDRRPAQQEV